jgi:hypothetical protein
VGYWYVKVGLGGSAIIQLPNEIALVLAIGAHRRVKLASSDMLVSAYDFVTCRDE